MNLRLECPECEAKIKYKDINVNKALAKCHTCHNVHTFEKTLATSKQSKSVIELPKGIRAFDMPNAVDFEISWRKSATMLGFLTFFAVFWNGIIGVFLVTGLLSGDMSFLWGMSFHLIAGLAVGYYVLALYLNTTYIGINRYDLTVEHSPFPIPFFKTHEIPTQDIEQLHVERYVGSTTNDSPNYAFAVFVKTKNVEKPIKLMKGLTTIAQGRYIEQEIEAFLDIDDEKVKNEWK